MSFRGYLSTAVIACSLCQQLALAAAPLKITGAYECNIGKSIKNNLYVKQLGPNKFQFGMDSLWIGNAETGQVHTGAACGTVVLKNNVGTFPDGGKLTFKFAPNKCTVTCAETNMYGGMNVDPNGTYKKVSSAVPSEAQLNPQN